MDSEASRSSLDPQEESSQQEHLLEKQGEHGTIFRVTKKRPRSIWVWPVLTHAFLVFLYTSAFIFFKSPLGFQSKPRINDIGDVLPYCRRLRQILQVRNTKHKVAPANKAIELRKEVIDSTVYKKSPYSGNPSKEIDQAWNKLTNGPPMTFMKDF